MYRHVGTVAALQGDTDLNDRSVEAILADVGPGPVLEVGCGRGYLAGKLCAAGSMVTATDIVVADTVALRYPDVTFVHGNVGALPFSDRSFDTVVCTHTLEHVQDLQATVSELRRVARRQLIIVVPRQRPYKYTFSLHVHFFPYRWSLQSALGLSEGATVTDLGDWYIIEAQPDRAD